MDNWKVEVMNLAELQSPDYNPRVISDKAFEGLKSSLNRFGLVLPIIWNKQTGNIVGGNQRYRALVESGETKAPVYVIDISLDDEIALNATMNNPHVEGKWNDFLDDILNTMQGDMPEFYESLNFDKLHEKLIRESTKDDRIDCPCCGHKWSPVPDDYEIIP